MESDSDLENNEIIEQRTSERRVEQQLDDFRAKWKKEIQQRTVYGHVLQDKHKQEEEVIDQEEQAKHFFQRATELEREGKLYDAIKFYRAAMQLVPDIEFRMARKNPVQPTNVTTTEVDPPLDNLPETEQGESEINLIDSFQRANIDDNELSTICTKNFPQQATHISSLPSEVLIYIFRWIVSSELDVRSLEQCARVCRGFYLCARDPQLWRMICLRTWGAHAANSSTNVNWRHMFIHRPHVVFNGVYIGQASYIRQGEQSLDSFYSPWHLVQYYRFIRFFPDGMVIIHTSADEPRLAVARLKSRCSKDPGIIYGDYRLQSNRVLIVAKRLAQRSTTIASTQRRAGREPPPSDIEQTMHMEFEMSDAGKRKHHQLIWTHYEIRFTNKRTGDERATTLDVHDRHAYPPLIFSRVKSYTSAAEQPLK